MGLDSFSEEYGLYWHTLLVVSIPVSVLAAVAAGGYLWRTRDRSLASIAPAEELRRYHVLAQCSRFMGSRSSSV